MNLYINHFSCRNPFNKKEDKVYSCKYLIEINMFNEDLKDNEEYVKLVDSDVEYFSQKRYNGLLNKGKSEDEARKRANDSFTERLKPHVIDWLKKNVKNRKDPDYKKGYSYGNDDANEEQESFKIYFHRKKEALSFIENFSKHKKPLNYYNYFKNENKKLNLKTNKLEIFDPSLIYDNEEEIEFIIVNEK